MMTGRTGAPRLAALSRLAVGVALGLSLATVPHALPRAHAATAIVAPTVADGDLRGASSSRALHIAAAPAAAETQTGTALPAKVDTDLQTGPATTPAHRSLSNRISDRLRAIGLPDAVVVLMASALPVVELRAGIPLGFVLGLPVYQTFLLSVVGNLLPILPVLLLLRLRMVQSIAHVVLDRARHKADAVGTANSRAAALALFVGIPLPGTGAWTGAMIAFVLGMPTATAFPALTAGVLMAGVIVTALCVLGTAGAAVAGAVLGAVGIGAILRAATTRPGTTRLPRENGRSEEPQQ